MHASNDPRSTSRSDRTPLGLLAGGVGEPSEVLDRALVVGETISTFLDSVSQPYLAPAQRSQLRAQVAGLAARGAYAGLGLWALNALAIDDPRTGRLSEALTGLSIGMLKQGPLSAGRN